MFLDEILYNKVKETKLNTTVEIKQLVIDLVNTAIGFYEHKLHSLKLRNKTIFNYE